MGKDGNLKFASIDPIPITHHHEEAVSAQRLQSVQNFLQDEMQLLGKVARVSAKIVDLYLLQSYHSIHQVKFLHLQGSTAYSTAVSLAQAKAKGNFGSTHLEKVKIREYWLAVLTAHSADSVSKEKHSCLAEHSANGFPQSMHLQGQG